MIKFELTFKPEALAKMCMTGGPEATAATVEAIKKILMEDPSLAPLRELFDISVRNTDDETHEESPKSDSQLTRKEIEDLEDLMTYVVKSSGMMQMLAMMSGNDTPLISIDDVLEANLLVKSGRQAIKRLKGE